MGKEWRSILLCTKDSFGAEVMTPVEIFRMGAEWHAQQKSPSATEMMGPVKRSIDLRFTLM